MMNKEERKVNVLKWVALGLTLVAGLIVIGFSHAGYRDKQNGELLIFVNTLKAAINPDRVVTLKGDSSDLDNVDYQRLKEQLTWVVNSSNAVRYVYLMGFDASRSSDKMFFYVDAQPDKIKGLETNPADLAEPGEIYQETDADLLNVFKNGGSLVTKVPETDKWGTFISAVVPITERGTGRILAVVGADFEIKNEVWEMFVYSAPGLLILFLILSVELVVFGILEDKKKQEINAIHLSSVLEHSDDAIYSTDLEGNILSWNLGAEKIFGYSFKDIVGKNIKILVPEDLKWEVENNLLAAREGKKVFHNKTKRINKWGKTVEVSLNVSPVFDQSMVVIGISIIARDISQEQKEMGEIEKKNKEIKELNDLMVNREMKMIELKKKIEELEAKVK